MPAFHARASEDERFAWNFFVRHYAEDEQQQRDDKFCAERNGVLYPRCATLGGCTAHNAMILVYPHNRDWDGIAAATGDASWESASMRRYFERLERCEYRRFAPPASRHGLRGWLAVNVANPLLIVRDAFVQVLRLAALGEALHTARSEASSGGEVLPGGRDPNDWGFVQQNGEGLCVTPLTTHEGRRVSSREYVESVRTACPGRLVVQTHALATKVLLDDNKRATGVQYLAGVHLYRADPRAQPGDATGVPVSVTAKREVILCAGAFNTPQLLKLSGDRAAAGTGAARHRGPG